MNEEQYLIIEGRRWRRSDPGIPNQLRAELVHELMRARRSVAAAKRRGDDEGERLARRHVHDAKIALGERGPAWWEPQTDATLRPRVAAAIRALLRRRGVEKTICPSDVARIVGGKGWRTRMQGVRTTALELVAAGELEVRQKGKVVSAQGVRGPMRLALRRSDDVEEERRRGRTR